MTFCSDITLESDTRLRNTITFFELILPDKLTRSTQTLRETSAIHLRLLTTAKSILVVDKSYLKGALYSDDVAYLVMKC